MRTTSLLLALPLFVACNRVAEGTKNVLNKGGELAGSAATEVIEGVTTGVEETWGLDVTLSDELKSRGLAVGKVQVEADSADFDNTLIVYLSTAQAYSGPVQAVATDENGREMGRSQLDLDLAEGGANYFTFRFQSRTDLERKSHVVLR